MSNESSSRYIFESNNRSVNKSLQVLDPVFSKESDWPTVRQAFSKLQKLLELAKRTLNDRTAVDSSDSFFILVQRLSGGFRLMFDNMANPENLTEILDLGISILHDGARLTQSILDRHIDDIQL